MWLYLTFKLHIVTYFQSGEDLSFLQDKFSLMIEAEVDRRLQAEAQLREEREKQERQLILLEKEQVCTSSVPTYFLLDWLGLIFVRFDLYI